ncbi:MAG: hypothetical protein CM1200mP41_21770 [Gammaproteobacteria bacterium]|nr:MAG: hypothetical protein CM1200mP41_21770 [Gammaproteobacteria bacterium]
MVVISWLMGSGAYIGGRVSGGSKTGGVLVPMSPGTLCAYGQLRVRSGVISYAVFETPGPEGFSVGCPVERSIEEMEKEAQAWAKAQGDGLTTPKCGFQPTCGMSARHTS